MKTDCQTSVAWLSLVLGLALMSGCAENPYKYAKTPFDNAHVTLRAFEDLEQEILQLLQSPSVSESVKEKLRTASHDGTLAAAQLGGAVVEFEAARAELVVGQDTSARLVIANNNLLGWTQTLKDRMAAIKSAEQEIKR